MCSWCYGFRPVWQQVLEWCLSHQIEIEYLMGGLAPDSDEVMPQSLQLDIQSYWRKIESVIPGTQFNFDFWKNNQPRRSTYRSCRAVIAAKVQQHNKQFEMIHCIQNAYYQQALNPSDREPLIECAKSCGLDIDRFIQDLDASYTQDLLRLEMLQCRQLGLSSFPSMLLAIDDEFYDVAINYTQADQVIEPIKQLIATH